MQVSAGKYNNARQILVDAGSRKAEKSHKLHGGDIKDCNAKQLLIEARDEFRAMNEGAQGNFRSGMLVHQRAAILAAAAEMGIDNW